MKQKPFILCYILLGLILLTASGCRTDAKAELSSDEQTAADYVQSQGYEIVSNRGETNRYILDNKRLIEAPYMLIWGLQNKEPEFYLGKEIVTYGFIVRNHPLETIYNSTKTKSHYQVDVEIMLAGGKVIGGTSFPVSKNKEDALFGSPSALDGQDLETVTGMSYPEWVEAWMNKYGE